MSFAPYAALGNTLIAGYAGRAAARSQQIVFDAEAKARNVLREGQNELAAAKGNLANYLRSENNKRVMAAAGQQFNAAVMTAQRLQEATTQGNLEDQIRAAEQAGAYAANVAFSGAQGASADNIDYSMRAQQSRRQFYKEQRQGYATYDAMQQIIGIIPQASAGLDIGFSAGSIDYGIDFARQADNRGNMLTDLINFATTKTGQTAISAIGSDIDKFFKQVPEPEDYGVYL